MSQATEHQYQVAWFKLSNLIQRKEKERALGIHRLLMHTIDNPAFAKQLEGDLLVAFNDLDARNSYTESARLYRTKHQLSHATAVYEQLVKIFPHEPLFLQTLVTYYLELNHPTRIVLSLENLIEPLIGAHQEQETLDAIKHVSVILAPSDQATLYTQVVIQLIKAGSAQQELIQQLIKNVVILLSDNPQERDLFINTLNALHTTQSEFARTCIITQKRSS